MEKEKPDSLPQKILEKLLAVKDNPHRTATSFAVGVFLGILPGTGPIAALTAAHFLRLNRPIALLGSLVTNTWLSILTFVLSIRFGASIMGLDWNTLYRQWLDFFQAFAWDKIFSVSFLQIVLPIAIGYTAISSVIALAAYGAVAVVLTMLKTTKKHGR
jgi:uncharacterized protein (DUF2062 family)